MKSTQAFLAAFSFCAGKLQLLRNFAGVSAARVLECFRTLVLTIESFWFNQDNRLLACPPASSPPGAHSRFCHACTCFAQHAPAGITAIITAHGVQKSPPHTVGAGWLHSRAEYLPEESFLMLLTFWLIIMKDINFKHPHLQVPLLILNYNVLIKV